MVSNLNIQEIFSNNVNVLILKDASFYAPAFDVENGVLEVISPGFDKPVLIKVKPNFNISLNSSNLKIATAKTASQLTPLPDGIYSIRYSVKPNTTLFVEYALLKNTRLLETYYQNVCTLFADRCKLTKEAFEETRRSLQWIKDLIDASKWSVEERNEECQGLDLYNEAKRLLDMYNNCIRV